MDDQSKWSGIKNIHTSKFIRFNQYGTKKEISNVKLEYFSFNSLGLDEVEHLSSIESKLSILKFLVDEYTANYSLIYKKQQYNSLKI